MKDIVWIRSRTVFHHCRTDRSLLLLLGPGPSSTHPLLALVPLQIHRRRPGQALGKQRRGFQSEIFDLMKEE